MALHHQSEQHHKHKFARLGLLLLVVLTLAAQQPGRVVSRVADTPALGAASARSQQQLSFTSAQANLPAAPSMPEFSPLQPFNVARAKLMNAATPFAKDFGPTARPFLLSGSELSRQRAVDCLASAMLYEAGTDSRGQQAVGQVILNRVRNSAFPASVCGVIFQGSERSTGCQFTFTCDGAMRRIPSPQAFLHAQMEARALLGGAVDPEVGLATHYHTDWVRPYWSGVMDKIAQVDTHLFFRWPGQQGRSGYQVSRYAGEEPSIPMLSRLSSAHGAVPVLQTDLVSLNAVVEAPTMLGLRAAKGLADNAQLAAAEPRADDAQTVFQLSLTQAGNGGAQALAALDLCKGRTFCKVVGRFDAALGSSPGEIGFLYVRDRRTGVDRAFWNCEVYHRSNTQQCFNAGNGSWIGFDGNLQSGSGRSSKSPQ